MATPYKNKEKRNSMPLISELLVLQNQVNNKVQTKATVKDHQRNKTPANKNNYDTHAIKSLSCEDISTEQITEERRSGDDRRKNEEIKVKRFDPRNKNDRRKPSEVCIKI